MADQQGTPAPSAGRVESCRAFTEIAERSQLIVNDWLKRSGLRDAEPTLSDSLNVATLFLDLTSKMMSIPASVVTAQMSLWQDYFALWQSTTSRLLGPDPPELLVGTSPVNEHLWHDADIFGYVERSFLLASRWAQAIASGSPVGGDALGDRALGGDMAFYTRQFLGALSASEFSLNNPEMLRATIESGGENLITGLGNLLKELEVGGTQGSAPISRESFVVGETVARTPGKVIFRNTVMEVLQYEPQTARVLRRPLLFVPAWTGRYYLLDLRPTNSLVRWAVDRGHTVFMISWVDPGRDAPGATFEDYVTDGLLTALDVVTQATGSAEVNAVGHCLGGTLLVTALAHLAAGGDERIRTASFLTSLFDFAQPGELGMLMDEASICLLEEAAGNDPANGAALATACARQRQNDLLWSFVVNNHVLGSDPFPFDLLHWNRDPPCIPPKAHGFYLHALYQQNRLVEHGGITLAGRPLDLRKVAVPAYVLAAREDHIVPWKSAYRSMRVLGGSHRFTLAASGHLAGVVNPPAADRYCYWTNPRTPDNPDEWRAGAKAVEGSWWRDWDAWLRKHSGEETVPAREPGGGTLPPLGDAPGSYVA